MRGHVIDFEERWVETVLHVSLPFRTGIRLNVMATVRRRLIAYRQIAHCSEKNATSRSERIERINCAFRQIAPNLHFIAGRVQADHTYDLNQSRDESFSSHALLAFRCLSLFSVGFQCNTLFSVFCRRLLEALSLRDRNLPPYKS